MQGSIVWAACGTFAPTSRRACDHDLHGACRVPANAAVAITATSVTDNSKSGAAAITLTNGTWSCASKVEFGNVNTGTMAEIHDTGADEHRKNNSEHQQHGATAHFSQMNDCGASVGAGLSCTITVTFTPGPLEALPDFDISDSSADSPQVVYLSARELHSLRLL